MQVRPRSGLALKHGITVLNSPGTVDSGFRNEVMVLVINHGREPFVITRGMRVAQAVIAAYAKVTVRAVADPQELGETARGKGGFGSTGTQS
jgi:dUTP pyrophosphatase